MKKLVCILVFGFFSLLTFAQVSVRPGVKLGLNYSNFTNTSFDYKVGLLAGGVAIVRLSDLYTLQPEILYSRQGGKSNDPEFDDLKTNYLSIAISNKFFIIPDSGFHVILGPYFDFNNGDGFIDFSDAPNPSVNFFDFGYFAGIGYELDFGLIMEARYKGGTVNVDLFSADNDERFNGFGNTLTSVFQLAAIYKFDF